MKVLSDGRVRRTEAEWRAIVERFDSSGLSETAFCRRAKLPLRTFRQWRERLGSSGARPRRLRAARRPRTAPTETSAPQASDEGSRSSVTPSEAGRSGAVDFELVLPGGVLLRWRA
jgi:hypothetical protein